MKLALSQHIRPRSPTIQKMNFLAHIYLSGNNELVKVGNLMADGIRGRDYEHFPIDIKKGILLHRAIDTFTDAHPIFRTSKRRLHEKYRHYSGVIVDVFYDHFLAKDWNRYSDEKLEDFTDQFYKSLEDNFGLLTLKAQNMLPYMKKGNWLFNYQFIDGIERILFQMDRRTPHESNMRESIKELHEFYGEFEKEFSIFFQELQVHAAEKLKTL